MRRGAIAAALFVLALGGPTHAQTATQVAAVNAGSVADGLEAQFRAALIRERRLADDREVRLIADAETRMRRARAALANATGDRAVAQAALDAARVEYAQLVHAIPLQEAATRIEVEAFRAELEGRLPEATPELFAAYQEFADGDRAAAWSTLEPLISARARARVTAARSVAAAEVRQLAQLRDVMRINGEATAQDVLALWDQAATLDLRHFGTHIQRSRLAQTLNRLDHALLAAQTALDVTDDRWETGYATDEIGDVLLARNDLEGALTHYQRGLGLRRAIYSVSPTDVENALLLSTSRLKVGGVLRAQNDLDGALRYFTQSLEGNRTLQAAHPASTSAAIAVWSSLTALSEALIATGDTEGAVTHAVEALQIARRLHANAGPTGPHARMLMSSLIAHGDALRARDNAGAPGVPSDEQRSGTRYTEALTIARALREADPGDADRTIALAIVYERMGDVAGVLYGWSDPPTFYRQSLALRRELSAGDPSNAAWVRGVAIALERLGDAQKTRTDLDGALASHRESLALRRTLRAGDPSNAYLARDVASSLAMIGELLQWRSDNAGALTHYLEALEIDRALYSQDRRNVELARNLSDRALRVGDVLAADGDPQRAAPYYREARMLFQRFYEVDPSDATLARDLSIVLAKLAEIPGAGVVWAEVVAFMEQMQARGQFLPLDRQHLELYRRRAAEESGG